MRRRLLALVLVTGIMLISALLVTAIVNAQQVRLVPDELVERVVVTDVELLGLASVPAGLVVDSTTVGGLSALTYDADNDRYYVLSDDGGNIDPARFYTVQIDLSDGLLTSSDLTFSGATTLLDESNAPYLAGTIDPEGLALGQDGTLFVASEGFATAIPPVDPFVREFALDGRPLRSLSVPDKFLPDGSSTRGVRSNLGFESLTSRPDARFLFAAVENALAQDGPASTLDSGTLSRIAMFDQTLGQPVQELVYVADAVADAPAPAGGLATSGLVELQALDNNGSFLALERSFSDGAGFTVKLYQAQAQGALDVSSVDSLFRADAVVPFEIDPPVEKSVLIDFADLGLGYVDNIEGMTFGPDLPDGRKTLILVSDNNFATFIPTRFFALALTTEAVPAALPVLETPYTLDDENPPAGVLAGDSNDPAIWLHPTDRSQSLIALTLKDGGLVTVDLAGEIVQRIAPNEYGDVHYSNVDVVYNFSLGSDLVDLMVASDRENDTLAVWQINSMTRQLIDVTSAGMPETIFGVDNGEATAYGLAAYTSPRSGTTYVFVTQADGNRVAQLALDDDGAGGVAASPVRMLQLPVPTGNPADSQSEGVVVDRFLGHLYVAMQEQVGILKFNAEPDGGDAYSLIHSIDQDYLEPDIAGLTIYYGIGQTGYLLVSSKKDHSYAVLERTGDNAYLGSFVVAGNGAIDQANESKGVDMLSTAIGPDFPFGLLVVQDGANDPQNVVENDEQLENNSTNFKFVPWQNVAGAFVDGLLIDPAAYNPRYPMRIILPVVSGE